MIKTLILIIDILLTIGIGVGIIRHYYNFYGRYMHGIDLGWNKMIEKPRLFYLSLLLPTYYILQFSKHHEKTDLTFWIIEIIVLIISFLLICTMTNKVLNQIVEKKHSKELEKNKKFEIIYTKEKTTQIFDKINNVYVNTTYESLYCFLNQIELGNNEKIIWIDKTNKKNHTKYGSNRNTLIEFIKVAHNLDPEEINLNNKINSFIKLYFLNSFNKEFKYNDNNTTRSLNNKAKYLDKISRQFHLLLKI